MRLTVTIARQLGSGGSVVGQEVAKAFQVRCLDREIVSRTATRSDLTESEVAAREERISSFWERMLTGFIVGAPEAACLPEPFHTRSDKEIFDDETEVMKSIAEQEDCVIVGRAAGQVLALHDGMTNILLVAPLKFRIPRVMQNYGVPSAPQARAMIERSDAARGHYIAQMTGRDWLAAENYHLCLDSSTLPLPEISGVVVEYIKRKLAQRPGPQ